MSDLTPRERELVALGAAMGSNCVPCIEYHIPESRKVGLTDPEIHAAIQHADKIRQVPARKTLQAALNMLSSAEANAGNVGTSNTAQPMDVMAGKMSEMMATCGSLAQSAGVQNSSENKSAVNPKTSEGCC